MMNGKSRAGTAAVSPGISWEDFLDACLQAALIVSLLFWNLRG